MRTLWAFASICLAVVPCVAVFDGPCAAAESPIQLHDVTAITGIDFRHTDGSSGRRYIIESVASGLALLDYDLDGDVDIYFLNGAPLPGADASQSARNALYRNDGGWHFTDVTMQAGLDDAGYGLGVAAADYDNDGTPDIYVNNFGPNVFYRNNGDGTFSDATVPTRTEDGKHVGAGAAFLDINADGNLDLYVGHYIKFRFDLHKPNFILGVPSYRGPKDYVPDPDALYQNQGDGQFRDISSTSGISDHAGTSMGLVATDYDNDGDTDVYVANDVHSNFFFQNEGHGQFTEVGLITGTAFDYSGIEQSSMGVDCADYNNDGWLDLFVTDYQGELPVLYKNSGLGFFEDVTIAAAAGLKVLPDVNWGTGFADLDNDGDRDLFIACGHVQDNIEKRDNTTAYRALNHLLMNDGHGRFADVSETSGDGLSVQSASRGTAFDDLDNDGDIDIVVLNSRSRPTILRNNSNTTHHWLDIELIGRQSNRSAVGARVEVTAGDLVQVDEVHSGRGYQSHHGTRLHFGLGSRKTVDTIKVRWMGGRTETFHHPRIDRVLRLREGMASRMSQTKTR